MVSHVIYIEVHDDDWEQFIDALPLEAITFEPSQVGLEYTRVAVSDPKWITWFRLKYPWINY